MFTSKKDKLFTAIVENDLVTTEKLLKGSFLNSMSPNYEQKVTPWIQSGQIKVENEQNIWEISDMSPLHLAIVLHRPQIVKKLLEHKANANKQIFYTQLTSPTHAICELLTPLFFAVYGVMDAANKEDERKKQESLEIYCMLRAANARLVGIDDPDSMYFGTTMAQMQIDRHMQNPEFQHAYEQAEQHYQISQHVSTQKSVFVEKLAQREERNNEQPKAYPNQQIKL